MAWLDDPCDEDAAVRLKTEPFSVWVQYVPKVQTVVLSCLKHLKLLMEQLPFGGVGPSWQPSDVLEAAGSLPHLETLALQLLKPTPEMDFK